MSFTYKGLKADYEKVLVTDEDIDQQLLRLQQQNPKLTQITGRPAQLGDEVVLDYAGFCDGVQFDGGTAENQSLTLGSGAFIPGFEEQLVGKNPEEPVTVTVTFPTEYHAADLAGKQAEFRCVIHQIRAHGSFALDDDFAQRVGQCQSLEQLRGRIGESLQQYYDERAEMELQDKLIRKAAATLDFAPTQAELDEALDEQLQMLQTQLAQRNLTLEAYCQFTGDTLEQVKEDMRPEAEQNLRIRLTMDEIARLEGLEANEQDVAEEYASICRQNQMTMEQLQPYLNDAFKAAVRRSVRAGKALQLVRREAEIGQVTAAKKQ